MNRFLSVSLNKGCFFMLCKWISHKDYKNFVVSEFYGWAHINPSTLFEYQEAISFFTIMADFNIHLDAQLKDLKVLKLLIFNKFFPLNL